ncbi:hypothetical protein [Aquimarina algiphila]|uniref:Uncharacterized protein n=1 Tax=Aquimarina algiphila TaxID=2047982 RepID=A0A554VRI7_9FLAO|nr:hypothetical protein [Aquimarina algiphila]TSE11256.1 hypothetical protein FOF46_01110 [Aquimarina algiphila]
MSWCIKHGLKIYPQHTMRGYKIIVAKKKNGRWKEELGTMVFPKNPNSKQPKWWEKIFELYEHYYDKYYPRINKQNDL